MRRVSDGGSWEARFGHARAVRSGPFVAVSATAAVDDAGRAVSPDAEGQTAEIFGRIAESLRRTGARLSDVVRLRVYHAGADVSEGFARAVKRAFPGGVPAVTTVHVVSLATPELLLEIEAEAFLTEPQDESEPGIPPGDEQAD
jgi:enamine deaminase RidA (YjgF/YER057c/UK114 family)